MSCHYVNEDLKCALINGKPCELDPETGKCIPLIALDHRRGKLDTTGLGLSATAMVMLAPLQILMMP
mgnify:CR=1 FL=1